MPIREQVDESVCARDQQAFIKTIYQRRFNLSHFSNETVGEIFRIKCPQKLDAAATAVFLDQSKVWIMSSCTHFVLDFAQVTHLSRDFYRAVIQWKSLLKPDGKVVFTIVESDDLLRQLRADGMDAVFGPVPSFADVVADQKKTSSKMSSLDTEFVKALIRGTKLTFEVQCHTPLQVQNPYLKTKDVEGMTIAAVMPLISNGWAGNFALCMSKPVFLKVYENMFNEKHTEITPELEDAVSELVNIIYGAVKTDLNPKGHNFQPTLPKVTFGENLRLQKSGPKPAVIVPFVMSAGAFHIEVEFEK